MSCDAKIRPFRPVNETEVDCSRYVPHRMHRAWLRDYLSPGSMQTISWAEGDRRSFTGEFAECPSEGCLLPASHGGRHES